ncbi:hypothetical protein GCM10025331_00740 [Actinoplanes utahensis]|nr:hypothetical protein Aut01nite_08020 [Actinoplanes utahensis]
MRGVDLIERRWVVVHGGRRLRSVSGDDCHGDYTFRSGVRLRFDPGRLSVLSRPGRDSTDSRPDLQTLGCDA